MAKGKYAKQTQKKPFYKKWWFIALVVVILIGAFGSTEDTDTPTELTETAVETAEAAPPATTEAEPAEIEEQPLELRFGELLDVTINSIDNIAVIKAKIQPSYSNEATINQNFFNIFDLIREDGFDQYGEVQYWAVADMSDGSEQKVISFTIDADLITEIVSNKYFVPENLADCEIDLWVHPSLEG